MKIKAYLRNLEKVLHICYLTFFNCGYCSLYFVPVFAEVLTAV